MLLGKSLGLSPELLASIINTSVRRPLETLSFLFVLIAWVCFLHRLAAAGPARPTTRRRKRRRVSRHRQIGATPADS